MIHRKPILPDTTPQLPPHKLSFKGSNFHRNSRPFASHLLPPSWLGGQLGLLPYYTFYMQEIFTCNQVEKPGSCLNLPRKKWGWFGGVNHPTKIIQNLGELLHQNHPKFWWIVIYLISFLDIIYSFVSWKRCSVFRCLFFRRKKEGGNIPMISTDKYQQWLLDRSRMFDRFIFFRIWVDSGSWVELPQVSAGFSCQLSSQVEK